MRLGIRIHDTTKLPFEERIADVHRLGFACGHLALSKVIDEFPTGDEALTPGLAMYIKNVFAKNEVDIAVLGCYLNLADPDKERLEETMHRYLAHIRFASWLDIISISGNSLFKESYNFFTASSHSAGPCPELNCIIITYFPLILP